VKRVAIVVEGDTEEEFVKQVLRPHLEAHSVATDAIAREISLETIREACPRFHAWVSQIES